MTIPENPDAISTQVRSRTLVRRGRDVCVDVIAEGAGPALVLLPSTGRDSEDFDPVAERLAARRFRVLRPQFRGILGSRGPLDGVTFHDYADDVAAVIRHLGDGPAVIVGHAFGNWIARTVATDHPDLVKGVVLAAAVAKQIPEALPDSVRRCSDPRQPREERLKHLRIAFFAEANDPAVWLFGWHRDGLAAQRQAARATPRDEWWGAGTAPILDLQALCDPWRPRHTEYELREELGARVTVKLVPDASHALLCEQPAMVADLIDDWTRTLK